MTAPIYNRPRNVGEADLLTDRFNTKVMQYFADVADEQIGQGRPILESHGQTFANSQEARDYADNLWVTLPAPGADGYDDLCLTGLVYGEAIVRYSLGYDDWEEADVESIGENLQDQIISIAERYSSIDISKSSLPTDEIFSLAEGFALAQIAVYNGAQSVAGEFDFKDLKKQARKAHKSKSRNLWDFGTVQDKLAILAVTGGALYRNANSLTPDFGEQSLRYGFAAGIAYEGIKMVNNLRIHLANSNNTQVEQDFSLKSKRIEILKGLKDGEPELIQDLTIKSAKDVQDKLSRKRDAEYALEKAVNNGWKMLAEGLKVPETDDDEKSKWNPLRYIFLERRIGKFLAVAAVGAAAATVGAGVGELVNADDPAATAEIVDTNQVGGNTGELPTTTTTPESTDQECLDEESNGGDLLPAGVNDTVGSEIERDGKRYQVIPVIITPKEGPVHSVNCLLPLE